MGNGAFQSPPIERPFVTMSLTLNLRAALKWAGKKVQNYMNQRVEEVFGLPLETFLKAVGYASSVVCLAAVVVLLVVLVCMGDQESIDVAVRLDGDLCKSFKCHALTFAAPVVSVLNHVALYHVWIRVFGYSMYDFYHGNLRHTKALEDFSTLSPFFIMVMIFEFSYGFLLSINVHLGMQQKCYSKVKSFSDFLFLRLVAGLLQAVRLHSRAVSLLEALLLWPLHALLYFHVFFFYPTFVDTIRAKFLEEAVAGADKTNSSACEKTTLGTPPEH
ncbi:uncharacterized protein LOC117652252 isoform X3 [Thrips palmi]|uniref:Uncharacterized protein LOC117652252 isoform X3 n=1 Tax=Thrips palmi TaxID=161013 RepID=A0A6P9A6M9_THRPL|nr:uncharacterized protein LOC117652252 isoform X3 [Thrips palmi]